MKKIIVISVPILVYLLISCSDDDPVKVSSLKKYPTNANMQWEYTTTSTLEYYDEAGNIIDSQNYDFGNTIVRIVDTQDSLGFYKNLIKFETFDVQTPDHKNYDWYSNSDSCLSIIAYSNSGTSQWVIPKFNARRYITLTELSSILKSPLPDIFPFANSNPMDSIIYYEIPRQALVYPLTVNKRWVELVYPFYRERYVKKIIAEYFQNQYLRCYIIETDWQDFDVDITDHINLNLGLIKREIFADSVLITSVANPDSFRFGRLSTNSNLVRVH